MRRCEICGHSETAHVTSGAHCQECIEQCAHHNFVLANPAEDINGASDGTGTGARNYQMTVAPTNYTSENAAQVQLIGNSSIGSRQYTGYMDELRIASVIRSADWILTEYNNQNSPSTFYTVT